MTILTIGQRIAKARHDKKMSQLKLSHYTNLSQAMISAYENDYIVPTEKSLRIIAQHLEVKVGWLRYGENPGSDDVVELERKFNVLINHLKIPPEIFNVNTRKESVKANLSTKRGRPKTNK